MDVDPGDQGRAMKKLCICIGALLALALAACGDARTVADAGGAGDGGVVKPDGDGAAGAPIVPCGEPDGTTVQTDGAYGCGACGTDSFYGVVCLGGVLACPGDAPPDYYVVDMDDYERMVGQCGYIKVYYYPGFMLMSPAIVETARDPASAIILWAVAGGWSSPSFKGIFQDPEAGEKAIKALVTVTDMTAGTAVEYEISRMPSDETLNLVPTPPLSAGRWYRITLYPGESQQYVNCHTYGRYGAAWLTAPVHTDFYTYSRPMVGGMFVAYKEGGKGYVEFDFTEWLVWADLDNGSHPKVFIDGAEATGCMSPFCGSMPGPNGVQALNLNLSPPPATFETIELRVPYSVKSVNGGTLEDGTAGNPHASIVDFWAVYTFKSSEMVVTDNGYVKRWSYSGE